MSRSANFRGVFGSGVQNFRLTIAGLEELQESCDAGPEEILNRLLNGAWRVADVREPLRLGLIGGGMEAPAAFLMVERYAGEGALTSNRVLAAAVVGAAIHGAPDEDAPPEKRRRRKAAVSPAESSGSPPSTKSVEP